jgi:hypothetical protein
MSDRAVIPTRTLRDEIVSTLQQKIDGSKVSGTARWIATQVNAPVRAVREELTSLGLAGTTKSRQIRSGETLYTLKDKHDAAWDLVSRNLNLN